MSEKVAIKLCVDNLKVFINTNEVKANLKQHHKLQIANINQKQKTIIGDKKHV